MNKSKTMKCVLCNAEWVGKQSTWTHPENDCPMAGSFAYGPIVLSINRAVKALKAMDMLPGRRNEF